MWSTFFYTVVITVTALYLPGFLFFRALCFSRLLSFLVAPVYAFMGYGLLAQAYSMAGGYCDGLIVTAPVFIFALICYVARCLVRSKGPSQNQEITLGISLDKGDWKILLLLLSVSFCLVVGIYVKDMDGAAALMQEYDNYSHIGVLRAFLETGNYSLLSTTIYPSALDVGGSPWGVAHPGFYPALLYSFTATMVSLAGCSLTLGLNAVISVVASILFASSMFLFVRTIFQERKYLFTSVLSVMAFASFPWGLLVFGPLSPNLLAFSLLPLFLALAMSFVSSGLRRKERLVAGLLAIVAGIAMVLAHPNAFFAAYVLLSLYLAQAIYWALQKKHMLVRILAVSVFLFLLVIGWCIMYQLPALQGVISFNWGSLGSKSQVLVNIVTVSFTKLTAPQWLLAFFVALGFVVTIFKRKYLWVSLTYALMGLIYLFGASSEGFLKHFMIGFWYTDTYRVASVLSIMAIPVASIGMVCFYELAKKIASSLSSGIFNGMNRWLAPVVFGVVFLFANFYPSFSLPNVGQVTTAFGVFHDRMAQAQNIILDQEEQRFVEQVHDLVGEEAVIINDPYDGSAYLYGSEGLQVFYRQFHGYDRVSETDYSHAIREKLVAFASDETVSEAVAQTNAQYVLLLDAKEKSNIVDNDEDTRLEEWDPPRGSIAYWKGLYEIDQDTPGFDLVLSEGDMRLYKIVAAE